MKSDLHAQITTAGVAITDNLHALILLQSLPDSYNVVQQALLATTNFSTINATRIVSLCACILSEEVCQGPSPSVSTIRRKMSTPSKDKCNYCGGMGHWEKDCQCKQCRLSCEEAQAERKGGNKKGKGKKGKEKEKKEEQTPVVSAVIVEIPDQPSGSTSAVPVGCIYAS